MGKVLQIRYSINNSGKFWIFVFVFDVKMEVRLRIFDDVIEP